MRLERALFREGLRSQRRLLCTRPPAAPAARQLFASDADALVLRTRLNALQAAWELQHAPGAKTTSYGVWPPAVPQGEVLLKRGKGWQAFGQHLGARTLLFPEEALFLMESDRLVCYGDVGARAPLSLHAGYAAAAAAGVTAERYAAFAHLCRMGFVVHRCGAPWFLDRRGWAHAAQEEALEREAAAHGEAAAAAAAPQQPAAADGGAAAADWEEACGDEPWEAAQRRTAEPAEAEAEAEDEQGGAAAGVAAAPPPAVGETPDAGASRGWWPRSAWEAPLAPPGAAAAAAAAPACTTAAAPAVAAAAAATAAAAAAGAPELVYDVWPPRSTFNKRNAGPPSFRLCLSSSRPPSCAELAALTAASHGVPVKCAIVRPGMFIGFDVSLG
jgi:hypothetical protein